MIRRIGVLLAVILGCTLAGAGIGYLAAHVVKSDYERNK